LVHRQAQLRLSQQTSRGGDEGLEKATADLEKVVQDRQHQLTLRTSQPDAGSNPLAHARLAVQLGLPVRALEILERSRVELFGTAGARLELELLLMLGRARVARDKLYDEEMQVHGTKLGFFDLPVLLAAGPLRIYRLPAYDWLRLWEAAGHGEYDRAASLLAAIGEQLRAEEVRANLPQLRASLAQAVAAEVLARGSPSSLLSLVGARAERQRLADVFGRAVLLPAERADLEVIAGLLALERGLPGKAALHLRRAIDLAPDFIARPVAIECLRRLEAARR
jgi:hypothetical protein